MIYSGEIQIASINLRDVDDTNYDVQSYLFLSNNYGVTWNCVYQNNNPKSYSEFLYLIDFQNLISFLI